MVYTLRFFSSKCSLFHNSNVFGSCITHILYTGCAKIKKNNSGSKRLRVWAWGPSGTFVRLRGSLDFIWGTKGPLNQGLGASGLRDPEPKCKSINKSLLDSHSLKILQKILLSGFCA